MLSPDLLSPALLSSGTTLATPQRINAQPVDYAMVAVYFALVLAIGVIARRRVATSLDFLLSGRSLPAWVTGLAFMSANLGATELLGQTANGAEYGVQTFHYYWIGAIPAMVFLGLVLMPFYYGSKVRSVPEYLGRRFDAKTQRLQAVLFALASVLLAGVNLYAMAIVVNALLGWPIWFAIVMAGVVVLLYTFLGGLSAAIYNEVLQFFVIAATMIPVTLVGLHRVGGWHGLTSRLDAQPAGSSSMSPFPAHELTGIGSTFGSVLGVVLGLGFVTSFGYWTTNFAEVQRAFSAKDKSAAQRTPLIAAFPKILIALVIVIPGMIAAVLVPGIAALRQGKPSRSPTTTWCRCCCANCCPTASSGWRSPACSPRSWPAWRPTSARSTPCSPTTSGRTGCARTATTSTTCASGGWRRSPVPRWRS